MANFILKKRFINCYGFSLIEVMIAVVLVSMMGVLLMTSINTSVRAKDSVEQVSSRFHEVRQAMSRMSREISMAYLSKNINQLEPTFVTQFKGEKNSLFFSAFGYIVRQKDAKESDQQVLGFFLAPDKNGQQALMRRIHPNLNLDVTKDGRSQVLCSNVSQLEFSYFDGRYEKWQDSWDSDPASMITAGQNSGELEAQKKDGDKDKQESKQENKQEENSAPKPWRLPSFIKISLTAEMEEGNSMTWVTQTEIPVQEPLDL